MSDGDLIILEELHECLEKHSPEGLELLEQNVKEDGKLLKDVAYALIDGKKVVIDGVHRLELAKKYGLSYETTLIEQVKTIEQAKSWMKRHEATNRPHPEAVLRAIRGKQRQEVVESQRDKPKKQRKNKEGTAREQGVSTATVSRDVQFVKQLKTIIPEISEGVQSGMVKLSRPVAAVLSKVPSTVQKEVYKQVVSGKKANLQKALADRGLMPKKDPEPTIWDDIAPCLKEKIEELGSGQAEIKQLSKHNMDQQREIFKLVGVDEIQTLGQAISAYEGDTVSPRDDKKQVIPDHLVGVMDTTWFTDTEKVLKKIADELKIKALRTPYWKGSVSESTEFLYQLAKYIGDCQPSVVCPACKGTGKDKGRNCSWCYQSGFMPAWQYNDWLHKKKAGV